MFAAQRFCLFTLICLMVTGSAFAESKGGGGGGGGSSGWIRRDFGLLIGLGSTFNDETASSTFYQRSGGFPELGLNLRFGLRTGIVDLGLTGSYSLIWNNEVKKADAGVYEKYRYDAHQMLGGGFVTYNLFGSGKDTTEILFEYYPYAAHSIKYADDSAQNPYRAGDEIKGNGWGLGFGGNRGDGSVWLLYRSLNMTDGDLGGTTSTWPNSSHSRVHVQTVTLVVGRSI